MPLGDRQARRESAPALPPSAALTEARSQSGLPRFSCTQWSLLGDQPVREDVYLPQWVGRLSPAAPPLLASLTGGMARAWGKRWPWIRFHGKPMHVESFQGSEESPDGEPRAPAPSARVRLIVADDHDLFRHGMRDLLEAEGFEVVAEAGTGERAIDLTEAYEPDVVLMDLKMPRCSGVEAIRELRRRGSEAGILVLTVSSADEDVLVALEAGADGYLLKDTSTEAIVGAIRAAVEGNVALSPDVARRLVDRVRRVSGEEPPGGASSPKLSGRELQVLQLMADGMPNSEIGEELFISPMTVKRHVSAVLKKLGVSNRVQAAIVAVRSGLV
jgi:DNA-binding NarL/FixJ family response regulator